jgi:hypothetical protein
MRLKITVSVVRFRPWAPFKYRFNVSIPIDTQLLRWRCLSWVTRGSQNGRQPDFVFRRCGMPHSREATAVSKRTVCVDLQ